MAREMTFKEFADWAMWEHDFTLPDIGISHRSGGTDHLGRILALNPIGSGRRRRYGPEHRRRLTAYLQCRNVMGKQTNNRSKLPMLDIVDCAGEHPSGYVICSGGEVWWQPDPVDPTEYLAVGVLQVAT